MDRLLLTENVIAINTLFLLVYSLIIKFLN